MKRVMILAALFLCLALIPRVEAQEAKRFDGTIRMGGSTTLLPVIADCASQFMEKYESWDKVDTSFPRAKILIYVTGGGSGFGIKAVMDGTVNIGMSSRDLKDAEKAQLGQYGEFLVSKDCLAFAV
ncbi:MAG TPA: substrate-binding domain-containing protein, partial [Thermodesulfobacteriota bacterium]|nr:substrate-binding domain-containing protein [Thermodesulfobacteriota bacterium]